MSETSSPEGPGKVLIWLLLLVGFIAAVVGLFFMAPWLQEEVNSIPGADAGAPSMETTSDSGVSRPESE